MVLCVHPMPVALKFSGAVDPSLWPPLIDGTYAIVMTLLVIELPTLTLELLHQFNHEELGVAVLVGSLLRLLGGYLGVFFIVYDIWAKKRRLLAVSERYFRISGFENFVVLISLFLATLVPPLFYVFNQVRQDYFFAPGDGNAPWLEKVEIDAVTLLFTVVGILIYCLIFLAASRRCRQIGRLPEVPSGSCQGQDPGRFEAWASLRALRLDAAGRILLAVLIPLIAWNWLHPPLPLLIYGFSGLWHTRVKPASPMAP